MTAKEIDDPEFFLPSEFLSDDFFKETKIGYEENPTAPILMGSSPESTLSGIGSWSFSSNDSPDTPSTPLVTPSDDPLELLNAAVGRVERLSLGEDNINRHVDVLRRQQEIINQQTFKFYQMKQLQLVKLQQQYANAVFERQRKGIPVRKKGLSLSEWPPLQKPQIKQAVNGSGTTTVKFNGGMRQSTGTGVFLPRQPGSQSLEPRRRQGKVYAPNININDKGIHPRMQGCNVHENDEKRNNGLAVVPISSPEVLKLPQEWTY